MSPGRLRSVLVMSGDAVRREDWAGGLERLGMLAIRCAGPENSICAFEGSDTCPLHQIADVAFYDFESVTPALMVDLLTLPRTLPIALARDHLTAEGRHEPQPVQVIDPTSR